MQPVIDEVKEQIMAINEQIESYLAVEGWFQLRKRLNGGAAVRYAMVCYRDFDCPDHPVVLPFGDALACKRFLDGVQAKGGGDWCEDVLTGLEAAVNLEWRGHMRQLFLIAQTPNHGPRFHDKSPGEAYARGPVKLFNYDDHYNVNTDQADGILKSMAEKRIGLQCLEISGSTAKMFEAFESVYNNKDEGLVMKVHSMTSDSGSILSTIVKASWSSVKESLTQTSASLVTAQDTWVPQKIACHPTIDLDSRSGWKMFEATIESIEVDAAVESDRVQDDSHRDFKIHEVTTNVWIAPKLSAREPCVLPLPFSTRPPISDWWRNAT
ncbi:vwkA [Symbiodinium sp. CCMP2592]|nr:vwkA [Symbiodinium sp. CCMP2592]